MKDHPFKMPFFPISNYLAIASLCVILVFMFLYPESTISLMVGVVFFVVMTLLYFVQARKPAKVSATDNVSANDDDNDSPDTEELD